MYLVSHQHKNICLSRLSRIKGQSGWVLNYVIAEVGIKKIKSNENYNLRHTDAS